VVYKILFTEDALTEIESALDYIRADNPTAAEQFGTALLNHVELLKDFPRTAFPSLGAPASASCSTRPFEFITDFTKRRD
jgi:plasmid stabilization system protein ParE